MTPDTNEPRNFDDLTWEMQGGRGDDVAIMIEFTFKPGHPLAEQMAGQTPREMVRIKRTIEDMRVMIEDQAAKGEALGLDIWRVLAYEDMQVVEHEGEKMVCASMHVVMSTNEAEIGQQLFIPEAQMLRYEVITPLARSLA